MHPPVHQLNWEIKKTSILGFLVFHVFLLFLLLVLFSFFNFAFSCFVFPRKERIEGWIKIKFFIFFSFIFCYPFYKTDESSTSLKFNKIMKNYIKRQTKSKFSWWSKPLVVVFLGGSVVASISSVLFFGRQKKIASSHSENVKWKENSEKKLHQWNYTGELGNNYIFDFNTYNST